MSKSKSKPAAKAKPAAKSKIDKSAEAAAPVAEPTVTTVADVPVAVAETPASKPERKAKPAVIEQNGVRRPAADSLCGRVWQALDDLRASGVDATAKNAAAAFDGVAIAAATIRTQAQRWREFNGVKREAKVAAPAVVSEAQQQQTA